MNEYKRSLADEIALKIIDQLHNATNRFSSASLELKKLCFVLVGIVSTAVIKFSDNNLDLLLFISTTLILFLFWLLDAFTYYYQEKLRESMDKRFELLKQRNTISKFQVNSKHLSQHDELTLENNRKSKGRIRRSFLNSSNAFYYILIIIDIILMSLHHYGIINSL